MPAQFRMPQEDPTTGAQPRLPGGDQPQGMFAHRSRGQHSLNQVTHTFVTVGHRNNWISLNVIYSNLHQLLQYQLNSMQRTHTLSSISYDFIARTAVVTSAFTSIKWSVSMTVVWRQTIIYLSVSMCNLAFFSDCTLHLKNRQKQEASGWIAPFSSNILQPGYNCYSTFLFSRASDFGGSLIVFSPMNDSLLICLTFMLCWCSLVVS